MAFPRKAEYICEPGEPPPEEIVETGMGPDGRFLNDPARGIAGKHYSQCPICHTSILLRTRVWMCYYLEEDGRGKGMRDWMHYRC